LFPKILLLHQATQIGNEKNDTKTRKTQRNYNAWPKSSKITITKWFQWFYKQRNAKKANLDSSVRYKIKTTQKCCTKFKRFDTFAEIHICISLHSCFFEKRMQGVFLLFMTLRYANILRIWCFEKLWGFVEGIQWRTQKASFIFLNFSYFIVLFFIYYRINM